MKKFYLMSTLAVLFAVISYSQSPQGFNYQAVVRSTTGELIKDQNIAMRLSIIQDDVFGATAYSERHETTTSGLGLVSLTVGTGEVLTGAMDEVEWGAHPYFLKVELDASGGTGYTEMSVSRIMSVPYSMYAAEAGNVFSGDYADLNGVPENVSQFTNDAGYLSSETDPVFGAHLSSDIQQDDTVAWNSAARDRLKWDGGAAGLDPVSARTSLELVPGSDVQAWSPSLDDLADGTLSASRIENGSYMISSAGTSGQVWKSDGSGAGNWQIDNSRTEGEVELFIANDIQTNYVPRDNGSKLVTGSIYDNGSGVGIGTTSLSEKLTISGNVMANQFRYSSSQTRYLQIPGGTGVPRLTTTAGFSRYTFYGDLSNGSAVTELYYPVDLPDGAVIKGIRAYLFTGSGITYCQLVRGTYSSGSIIGQITDDGSGLGWHYTSEVSMNHTVSKASYAYGIRCYNTTPGDNVIGSIRIRYEIANP